MAIKFSELLDIGRLRPLWQRGGPQVRRAIDEASPRQEQNEKDAVPEELGPPRLALESPHAVFGELEEALRANLGPRSLLVVHLMHPLRAAVRRIDAGAPASPHHPLEQATQGDIFTLIDKLDDTLSGLLRQDR